MAVIGFELGVSGARADVSSSVSEATSLADRIGFTGGVGRRKALWMVRENALITCWLAMRASRILGWRLAVGGCLLLMVTSGCGPDEFLKRLHQLRDDTKRQCNPADIRAAVLPMFSQELSSTNRLPKEITSLPIFSDDPKGIDVGYPLGNTNILDFSIGSGFGHWGIIVCRGSADEQQLTNDAWFRPRVKAWGSGVFFSSDFR